MSTFLRRFRAGGGLLSRRLSGLLAVVLVAGVAFQPTAADPAAPSTLVLHTRHREPVADGTNRWQVVERVAEVDARRSAVIVCDMWDRHWCAGATARVAEMAPRMNGVLRAARERGMLIIHAPSDTLKFYEDFPQRQRAREAPKAVAPADTRSWKSLDPGKEPPLPIDDSDGGCDDDPSCREGRAWSRQIAALEMEPGDVISDSGDEIYNVLTARGIETVIVLGVHANMCVLGRPFSIRSMVGLGKRVFLVRDMTDTMYNSRRRPQVSHFAGTDLVVAHIEKYWCPSITSADFLGGEPFRFKEDRRLTVALIVGENEYRTWETLPEFVRAELGWRGFVAEWVTASTAVDDFQFTNAAAVSRADLLVISVRRRALPTGMMRAVRAHLAAGKPVVGIRTASHAFALRDGTLGRGEADGSMSDWPGFDPEVLGGNYTGHHGVGPVTSVRLAEGAGVHPILTGVEVSGWTSRSSLYRCSPLASGARALLVGSIEGQPAEPLAWTHAHGPHGARVFYTSLGGPEDFQNPAFRRLLLNGMLWSMGQRIPSVSK